MNLKINLKAGVVVMVASLFLYSCSQDERITEDEAVFTDQDYQLEGQVIEGQYIIVYKENVVEYSNGNSDGNYRMAQQKTNFRTQEILTESSIKGAEIIYTYSNALSGATVKITADQATQLRGNNNIAYIEQDRIVTLGKPTCGVGKLPPCDGGDSGGGDPDSQDEPYGITRVNGGGDNYTGGNVAWIIDTGIDLTHPDLNVDSSRGFNAFTTNKDGGEPNDNNGHGSHVAGTVAAINNAYGVIGVAPGATVIPVKVLDHRGSGTYSGVIDGVDYVAANGKAGDVANMSLSGPASGALDAAVLAASNKKIWFTLAAGNDGNNANNRSPARVNGDYIVTISAMNSSDSWASWSNYGNPPVDYAAPGVSVKSTWKNGGYNTISGTSMAAPHAAGVLLLGAARIDGKVKNDPDGNADPIIVH